MDPPTPTRAKRHAKVPERFCPDLTRVDTANANGETIIDYNSKTTFTTHKLVPIGTKIKLKPALTPREPLKVKLPKLKRSRSPDIVEKRKTKCNSYEVKVPKIKLPSLLVKKAREESKSVSITEPHVTKKHKSKLSEAESRIKPPSPFHKTDVIVANKDGITKSANSNSFPETNASKFVKTLNEVKDCSITDIANKVGKPTTQIVVEETPGGNSSEIRCPCGVEEDLGLMMECERCRLWQHGHCINVGQEEDAYEGYVCAFCLLPSHKHQESLRQIVVDDKFQSRFEQLESSSDVTTENKVVFSINDFTQIIQMLRRVVNSLQAKFRILSSKDYPTELRIWRNPIWSDILEENSNQTKNPYFLDNCKDNLKLNLRTMLAKLSKRCELVDCQLKLAQNVSIDENHRRKLDDLRNSLRTIAACCQQVGTELKLFCSS